MSQLVLARGESYNKSLLQRIFPRFEVGPYFLILSLIVFVVLITVITLMFSTRQVTKGYVLHRLEEQHQELVKESERYEMQISMARSLNSIQESSKVRSMVRPANVVFIQGDTAIAQK